jgi:hypothetical protein
MAEQPSAAAPRDPCRNRRLRRWNRFVGIDVSATADPGAEEEMPKKPPQRVFSVTQVARACHMTREAVRHWVRRLGLPAYNTEHGLAIKIAEPDLRAFAARLNVYVDWDAIDDE